MVYPARAGVFIAGMNTILYGMERRIRGE